MATLQAHATSIIVSPRLAALRRRAFDWTAKLRDEPPTLTLYHQPGDAYSHLCAQRIPQLRERLNLSIRVVVIPTVANATNAAPELSPAYAVTDAIRIAPAGGLNFSADAQTPDTAVRETAERVRLTAGGLDAFLKLEPAVAQALFANDHDALNQLPVLGKANAQHRLHDNHAKLLSRGHYQGGMWHFRGAWYWALDRLNYLEQRLRGLNLVRGSAALAELSPADAHLPPITKPETLQMFYSFRSPYSYIAAQRSGELAKKYDVTLDIRPVLPMVMRGLKVPRTKRMYIVRDTKREADRLGIAFGKIADPLGGGVERCLAVFPKAVEAGRGLEFLLEAGRAIWGQGEQIKRESVLRKGLQRAGIDPNQTNLASPADSALNYAEANREALSDLGLWGVPSYQLGGLAVWGQDRLWLIDEALRRTQAQTSQ